MAIATYLDLQTAVGNWLNRADLSSRIPEFISLAQAKFNREIRVPDMLTRNDLATVDEQYESLPSDFLEAERYSLLTSPVRALEYITPEELAEKREYMTDSGKPVYFSVVGDSFEFLPTPADTYAASLLYYAAIDLTTTSWLLTDHPDVCLFGALAEAEPFVMNDERVGMWQAKLGAAIQSLRIHGDRKAVAGTPVQRTRSFG